MSGFKNNMCVVYSTIHGNCSMEIHIGSLDGAGWVKPILLHVVGKVTRTEVVTCALASSFGGHYVNVIPIVGKESYIFNLTQILTAVPYVVYYYHPVHWYRNV